MHSTQKTPNQGASRIPIIFTLTPHRRSKATKVGAHSLPPLPPRHHNFAPARLEVPRVAGDDGEVVGEGGGGDEFVEGVYGALGGFVGGVPIKCTVV